MATFKGDNSTISLVEEDAGWGKKPTTYAGGKYLQNVDGTFSSSRNSLQTEARTPNAELSGTRLGNSSVAGTFNLEIDPENYRKLFESLFYGRFESAGAQQDLAVSVSAVAAFTLTIPLSASEQTALGASIGDPLMLKEFAGATAYLNGSVVLISKTPTTITVMHPTQMAATLTATPVVGKVVRMDTLRPAKQRLSFNAEEVLSAEDGVTKARFMTVGAVASGVAFEMPQEGNIKAAFSMIGSGKLASKEYKKFDPALTNSANAHTAVTPHTKYTPLVLQDGAILSDSEDVRCVWLSGSLNIENGTEPYYTGCSYDAKGANSGKFLVTMNYEALFQSEDDFIAFQAENASRVLLRLKDRTTDKCILIYLPSFRATNYEIKNSTGLVTASITGSAEIDTASVNSCILGAYTG